QAGGPCRGGGTLLGTVRARPARVRRPARRHTMCGIAVLFEPGAPDWMPGTLAAMTRLARHRGPDGEGLAFLVSKEYRMRAVSTAETRAGVRGDREAAQGATLGLGHRRLSIIDLTVAGHQPMADENEECWITFNGEIYNYEELRTKLAGLKHSFHSGTDTEV